MSQVLTVEAASKSFGRTRALDSANLLLRRGEWLGLLGPNGAGKTTLIRAVAGRVRLDAGRITILGRSADHTTPEVRAELGVVPQEIALYPLLTAAENLEAFGRFNGLRGDALRQRVGWALDWTGLKERAREPVQRFSGGMKRRLNIACGVLHRPSVILLDEPTVGVDPQSRERIWEMCAQLRHEGASIVLTTHQLDEAQRICERIVIIDHGRTIADGTFDQLVAGTVGAGRLVRVRLSRPPAGPLEGMQWDAQQRTLTRRVTDVARELPALLAALDAGAAGVEDVSVESPSLQAVFIHLTGRELRE